VTVKEFAGYTIELDRIRKTNLLYESIEVLTLSCWMLSPVLWVERVFEPISGDTHEELDTTV
jgi:hypothetical protein